MAAVCESVVDDLDGRNYREPGWLGRRRDAVAE